MKLISKLVDLFQKKSYGVDNDEEISSTIESILFSCLEIEYLEHRKHVAILSHEIHKIGSACVPYLLLYYMQLLEVLSYKPTINRRIVNCDSDDNVDISSYVRELYNTSSFSLLHLSDFEPPKSVSNEKGIYCAIRSLVDYSNQRPIDKNDLNGEMHSRMLMFCLSRYFSNMFKCPNEFYVQFGSFIEMMNRDGYYQEARDFAEEAVCCSFKDDEQSYGYLTQFHLFTQQLNIYDALLYGNLMLTSIFKSNFFCHDLKKQMLFVSLFFMRNFNFIKYGEDVYNKYLANFTLEEYDRQKVDTAYLYLILIKGDTSVVKKAFVYLSDNIQQIKKYGAHSAVPWFSLINNIKNHFGVEYGNISGYKELESDLEEIIGAELANTLKDKILKGRSGSKVELINGLKRLSKTRNNSDLVHETYLLSVIANRVLSTAISDNDNESVILAHLVKSDGSIAFPLSTSPALEFIPLNFDITGDNTAKYESYIKYVSNLLFSRNDKLFIWLGSLDDNIYTVSFSTNLGYKSKYISSCKLEDIRNWLKNKLPKIGFEESRKSGTFIISYEEYWEEDSEIFLDELPSLVIDFEMDEVTEVVIFSDVNLSPFPHNLLKRSTGELISSTMPIVSTLSFDNYAKSSSVSISLEKINVWAPVEAGDFGICQAYSKLIDGISGYNIATCESIFPMFDVDTDLNIFIAHGGRDGIKGFKGLFPSSDKVYTNLDAIFGHGKVAIVFACHSGSVAGMQFSNSIHTLIKELLRNGYEAVIAPSWSLNIYIPETWCKEFISSLTEKNSITRAVYMANMAVKLKYKVESAWAAMHLFGNPNIHAL